LAALPPKLDKFLSAPDTWFSGSSAGVVASGGSSALPVQPATVPSEPAATADMNWRLEGIVRT
jgi:hypothetical protein